MPRSRLARPSLVALLCVSIGLELVFRRIAAPLLHVDLLVQAGRARDAVDFAGFFFYHLASVFGILLATLALARLLLFKSAVPRGGKVGLAVMSVAFASLAILGVWRPLPPLLEAYFQASFTMLVVMLMFAGWLAPRGQGRAKLGLFVVALPILLRLLATLGHQLLRDGSTLPALSFWIGEVAAVAAAVVLLPCFVPPRMRVGLPSLTAVVAASAAAYVAIGHWETAARIAGYGFGLQLPSSRVAIGLYAIAFGAWVLITVSLLARPGVLRLRGYGLALVGLSGFQLELPFQLAATLIGYLCLVESMVRQAAPAADTWRQRVREIAAGLGAREVEVAGDEGWETARVRVKRAVGGGAADADVEVALGRQAGELAHAEVVIGHAPSEEAPPVALARRGTPRLGRTRGEEVATGDLDFDEAFRIWDARRLTARDRVLDDDLRPRLIAAVDGWLAVWPGAGVRYRTQNTGVLDGGLDRLIELLLDLKNRS